MIEQLQKYFANTPYNALYAKDDNGNEFVYVEDLSIDEQYELIRYIDYHDLSVVLLTNDDELSSDMIDLLKKQGELL